MFEVSREEIVGGRLLRALLLLAAPLLAQNLVTVASQVIDLFWLGRLSSEAVAAVGLTFPLVTLLMAVVIFAPFVGTQVVVSQRVGAEDRTGARRTFFTGLWLVVAIGAVAGVVAFVTARPLVEVLTSVRPGPARGEVVRLAAAYLGVMALGLPLLGLSDTTEGAFVGWGDSTVALYMNVLAVVLNLVLDPILIFGLGPVPRLGIRGAALATIVGYGTAFLLGLALVARGRNGKMLSRASVSVSLGEAYELLDVGAPTAVQQATKQLAGIVLVVVVFAAGGAAALAAYLVGTRVASVAVVPAMGLQQAAQSVVGQNVGAQKPLRARRTTWLGVGVAGGLLAVVGLGQWLVPSTITLVFVPELGADALGFAVDYLRILALGYPAIGAGYILEAGFNGASRTRTSMVASILQHWLVRAPIATLGGLALGVGVDAVFWSVTISNVALAVGLGVYYHYATAGGMLDRAVAQAAAD